MNANPLNTIMKPSTGRIDYHDVANELNSIAFSKKNGGKRQMMLFIRLHFMFVV